MRPLARVLLAIFCLSAMALGQARRTTTLKTPLKVGSLDELGARIRYSRENRMSSPAKAQVSIAAARAQPMIRSIPHWFGSFSYQGTVYPYAMVGGNPRFGNTTRVNTDFIPISVLFEGYVDQNGNNILFDVTSDVQLAKDSPEFQAAAYDSGYTQFGDAVQRAEFWSVAGAGWHTLLNAPRMLTGVEVDVPAADAALFQLPSGDLFAVVDPDFWVSQLNTIVQLEPIKVNRFAITLSPSILLGDPNNLQNCCVLGFHTAFDVNTTEDGVSVQTFAWASWLPPGVFNDPTFADVTPLSHEISETLNDPFVNNQTPPWEFPDGSGCQANLETGDPIEVLPNAGYPVMIDGVLFHPQNEALLQWFSRKKPSDAIDSAYSFPDTSLLTAPSKPCPAVAVK